MTLKISITIIIALLVFSSCRESNDQLFERASELGRVKKWKEAIPLYSEIIKRNNKLQLAYFNRGLCYFNLNLYSKALQDFNKVVSLQMMGNFRITLNKESPFADEVALTQVDYNEVLYQRAQVKYYMDSIRTSFQDFQELIDRNYEKSNCLLWQGILWIRAGNKQKGCEYFQKGKEVAISTSDQKEAERMMKTHCDSL